MAAKSRATGGHIGSSFSPRHHTKAQTAIIKEKIRREFHPWCTRQPKVAVPVFWRKEAGFYERTADGRTARVEYGRTFEAVQASRRRATCFMLFSSSRLRASVRRIGAGRRVPSSEDGTAV